MKEMLTDLVHLQGIIQLLLRSGNADGARSTIASYGADIEHKMMFYTDAQGRILSSTRNEIIGRRWTELDEPIDPKRVERVKQTRAYEVVIAEDKANVYGYVDICVPNEPGQLRPSGCGFLYYRRDVKTRYQLELATLRNQALQQAAGIGSLSILLWLILHFAITRRMAQINNVSHRFSSGDWHARIGLSGKDELAKISTSLDSMYDAVVKDRDELFRSQAQTITMFETVVDGIITIDTSGIILSVNSAVERLFAYRRQQLIGQNVKMLMPDRYSNEHDGYIKHYLETGEKNIIGIGREVEGMRADGTVFPMDLSVSELLGSNEHMFIGVVRDISRRKQAEEQLLIREEQLSLTLDNAPTGIVTCDLDCRILTANSSYKHMVGYTDTELLQIRITDTIIHPEDREICADLARQAKSGRLKENQVTLRWLTKGGEILRGKLHIGLIHDEKGTPKAFVAQFEDQTKRLNAENEARQLRDRLAHVGRVSTMGEMAAGIAHEINQPLTAIASYAEACQRLLRSGKANSEDLLDAMERTSAQAHRAGQVIRRMRSFVKERKTQREELDVNELVGDVVELAKMDLPDQSSLIQLELAPALPKIIADSFQIQQVILNLIRNAADAMQSCAEENQPIIIRTALIDRDHIRIAVSDDGEGIRKEHVQKIFTPFFSTKESGMGIGLAICRSVVESHHGELSFENNPNGGATFNLTLPIESED